MNERLQILLAHGNRAQRDVLEKAFQELEHDVVEVCLGAKEMIERATSHKPDLIVTGVDLPDMDGISALVEISKVVAIPAIVVTSRSSLELVQRAMLDHVMAYLIEPVEKEEIKPTIFLVLRRFEQFQEMQVEVDNLRQALVERKVVERAKGVLMRREDIDEDAAYKKLRRSATDRRIRLIDVAQEVLDQDAENDKDSTVSG
jgi:response regulator NasT